MHKEHKVKKRYFNIGEVSEILDLPKSTIRYYQLEFRIIPKTNRSGIHVYQEEEIKLLRKVMILAENGFPMRIISKVLRMNKNEMKEFFNELIYKVEI